MAVKLAILLFGIIVSNEAYSTTHVANRYHEPIFVKVDTEHAHINCLQASANLGVNGVFSACSEFSLDQTWNKFIEIGFAEILPGEYVGFSPEGKTVYITIWTPHKGFIWVNVPQREDISFIVTSNGAVVRSKYRHIWVDSNGIQH